MFGSTAILPPRTKRWAEAKVLADCISVKICKLYLYNNEHSLALAHHSSHMRKFADLSRGWGIGEETFEFWSWLARQYVFKVKRFAHALTPYQEPGICRTIGARNEVDTENSYLCAIVRTNPCYFGRRASLRWSTWLTGKGIDPFPWP